ncbi:MAG: NAD-dependent epimerase/dehydratase family protein, partial [Myxococcales bacterium]|nr:NAD-dependent epimerase/dehydratase family protein [Myxococcales bacterium]
MTPGWYGPRGVHGAPPVTTATDNDVIDPMQPDDGRVLVTGGCGFIGHHLVAGLLARGRRVHVLDDLSTGSLGLLPEHDALTFERGSVLDEQAVARASRGARRVYHLAGVVGVRLASEQAEHARLVSDRGTELVLRHARESELVLVSSSAVYGRRHADPALESAALDESDALDYDGGRPGYATGKMQLERRARAAAAEGARVIVVRPFNVVGPHQSGRYGMVLPTFVRSALEGRPLVVYDDGAQTRAFSDVSVFVATLLAVSDAEGAWGGTFNLGTSTVTSVLELAQLVRRVTGREVPIECVPYERAFPGRRDVR